MKLSASGVGAIAAVIGVGVLAAIVYKNRAKIVAAFNPASTENLAYQGTSAIVQAITGNKIDSAGTAVANVFPSAAEKAVNKMLAPVATLPFAITTTLGPAPYEVAAPTAPNAGTEALTTMSPYMYGLGGIGEARVRTFKPGIRRR